MFWPRILMVGVALASSSPAGTIFVGFDDAVGIDYDYQDVVFSLSSASLHLNSLGTWQHPPLLTSEQSTAANVGLLYTPYWNQTSYDGFGTNIGFCIWGGGNCNGGVALDPGASYLVMDRNSSTGSSNDVTFSTGESIGATVVLRLAGAPDLVGWYNLTDPGSIHWLNSVDPTLTMATFIPDGDFGLIGANPALGFTFFSQVAVGGSLDTVSHFAFFEDQPVSVLTAQLTSTPEPGTKVLAFSAVLALILRLRKSKLQV